MPRPHLLALSVTLFLGPLLSGCVAVAAAGVVGVGVVQYQRNEVEQDFPNELDEVWKGTLEALRKLGDEPEMSELGATEGRIKLEDMAVLVERHAEGFTRVRVRVGTFHTNDHERRSLLVLQEIGASLEQHDELRAWAEKVQGTPTPAPE
jgi:hypothetical protein